MNQRSARRETYANGAFSAGFLAFFAGALMISIPWALVAAGLLLQALAIGSVIVRRE